MHRTILIGSILAILLLSASALCRIHSASAQPKEPETQTLRITVRDGLISMDVQNAEIGCVLAELAQKSAIALTIDGALEGRVSIKLEDVTLEEALRRLSRNTALVFEYDPDRKAYRIIRGAAYATSPKEAGPEKTNPSQESTPGAGRASPITKAAGDALQSGTTRGESGRVLDSRGRPGYKSGELLVKFKDKATAEQIDALHRSVGSTVLGAISRLRLQRVKLKRGWSEQEAIEFYSASDLVESVEKHALRYLDTIPNDPYFENQWGLTRIQAPAAWDISQGSPEIIIAVIDTGVDYLHPDLSDNIWTNVEELNGLPGEDDDGNGYVDDIYGWDFAGSHEDAPDDEDADPMDVNGHGTHVAGIIAASGDNARGIAGVCWQAKIMALKLVADDGDQLEDFDVISAIYYAVDQGARIANCSFGGSTFNQQEKEAFAYLRDAGILAVCAAGNESSNTDTVKNYPSGYNLGNIISVAASDQEDHLAGFSNWGSSSVDVMAPGVDITSSIPTIFGQARVTLNEAASTVIYAANAMEYAGTTDDTGITRPVYDCGLGNDPGEFPPDVNGNIALVKRDRNVYFSVKTTNAQNAGAIGVIVYNNTTPEEPDETLNFYGSLGESGDWVPVVSLSERDGEDLRSRGLPRPVTLVNKSYGLPSFYDEKNGTSMAVPHVSGIAGLLLSVHPGLVYDGLKSIILSTVDTIEPIDPAYPSRAILTNGRVNALSALLHAYLPGDVSGDNKVDLGDAILGLQITGGFQPDVCTHQCAALGVDVNEDARIGMEEVIYVIREIGGL
jgi:subtilisin family serine protease